MGDVVGRRRRRQPHRAWDDFAAATVAAAAAASSNGSGGNSAACSEEEDVVTSSAELSAAAPAYAGPPVFRPEAGGLRNLTNTCYLNAVVQALAHCPPILYFFLDCSGHIETTPPNSLTRLMARLVRCITSRTSGSQERVVLVLRQLIGRVKSMHAGFDSFEQQDAEEFLNFCLTTMHEELVESLGKGDGHGGISDPSQQQKGASGSGSSSSGGGDGSSSSSSSSSSNDTAIAVSGARGHAGSSHRRKSKGVAAAAAAAAAATATAAAPPARGSAPPTDSIGVASPVSRVFRGGTRSRITCQTCGSVSDANEAFFELPVEIPEEDEGEAKNLLERWTAWLRPSTWLSSLAPDLMLGPRLEDCLAAFSSVQRLSGADAYQCEACGGLREAEKSICIHRLPEVLPITLKRFSYSGLTTHKVQRHVDFPLERLDLSPYLSDEALDTGCPLYDLCAVVEHHGSSPQGGHYTCLARDTDGSYWRRFDDHMVSVVDPEAVAASSAYVLVYLRRRALTEPKIPALLPLPAVDEHGEVAYLSRCWLVALHTTTNPGPMDVSDFCCQHGGILPHRDPARMAATVPMSAWLRLAAKYGGGPLVTQLLTCATCERKARALTERRSRESARIGELLSGAPDPQTVAISWSWLQRWQSFVEAKSTTVGPPGPVDNLDLLDPDNSPLSGLRADVHYLPATEAIWAAFTSWYGGGPRLPLLPSSVSSDGIVVGPPDPAATAVHLPLTRQRARGAAESGAVSVGPSKRPRNGRAPQSR